ncbi:LOW QUALITY PROTEIN: thyrotropin-releasing hormone receptor-like [Haliotis rubra]|uniref:LOW QUALITY PROTEIN: thyrotropin-releasing hormone receptor-like n=1 Tax=Haliotis rubra TaxID=36100 RepID=UPI001EE606E1|nr:LOW QUALITY PROTEIN: thyrotropin-releasing hormone receptor-like [Haliotis rubra]
MLGDYTALYRDSLMMENATDKYYIIGNDTVNTTLGSPPWQTTSFWSNGNDSGNASTAVGMNSTHSPSIAIQILYRIHLVAIPATAIVGTIANLLAFFTFISKPLRRTSCSLYLAARSLSDTGFLLSLLATWIGDATTFQLYHEMECVKSFFFLTYFCGFLSVWLVVLITVENYIRICHPFTVARFCTVQKAKCFISGLCIIGVILYHFPLWLSAVLEFPGGKRYCNYLQKYITITRVFTFGDMILTLVIPSIAIILLMVGITYSLITSLKRQKRLKQNSERVKSQRSNGKKAGGSSPQAKVTKMLFAVSFIFLVLNLPSHAVRLRVLILTYEGEPQKPNIDQMLQVIFQILYYLSFAVNLGVYLACGDNFRKVFLDKYVSCVLRSKYMRRKSEVSHTSFTNIRLEAAEPMKEEETSLIT